ncbi:MAG: TetR/AcrR family transcriptional regulator [Chloroflexota bacterium]
MGYAKSIETRQKLVKTASKLIRTQGYAATGIQQILQESGVPKGSLYYHFPAGKSELAAEAVRYSNQFTEGRLKKLIEMAGGSVPAFQAFCDYYIASLETTDFQKGCPIATITLEAAATVDLIQAACEDGFAMIERVFIEQLVSEGVLPKEAQGQAMMAVTAVEGALILCRARRNSEPLKVVRGRIAQDMRDAIARGNNG